jgi:hypothetical protein
VLKRLIWSLVFVLGLIVLAMMFTTQTPQADGDAIWPGWLSWK